MESEMWKKILKLLPIFFCLNEIKPMKIIIFPKGVEYDSIFK